MKFGQHLCKNHSTLGAVVPLAMFNSISILTLLYFSILLNHDGTIIMETITEQRTQKLFNLGTYPAFQPETKETVACLQDLKRQTWTACECLYYKVVVSSET